MSSPTRPPTEFASTSSHHPPPPSATDSPHPRTHLTYMEPLSTLTALSPSPPSPVQRSTIAQPTQPTSTTTLPNDYEQAIRYAHTLILDLGLMPPPHPHYYAGAIRHITNVYMQGTLDDKTAAIIIEK